jgi:hypothetical protein
LKTIAKLGNGSDHSGNHLKMFYFEGSWEKGLGESGCHGSLCAC